MFTSTDSKPDDKSKDELVPGWATLEDCRETGWDRYCQEIVALIDWEILDWQKIVEDRPCHRWGYVSVWIGNFPHREIFDMYLGLEEYGWESEVDWNEVSPFCHDLDLGWVNLGAEADCGLIRSKNFETTVEISTLLEDLPWVDDFREPVLTRCHELGIRRANTVISLYDVEYDRQSVFAFGYMCLVGSFRYIKKGT